MLTRWHRTEQATPAAVASQRRHRREGAGHTEQQASLCSLAAEHLGGYATRDLREHICTRHNFQPRIYSSELQSTHALALFRGGQTQAPLMGERGGGCTESIRV